MRDAFMQGVAACEHEGAAEHVAVAAEIFRGRVHDDIGAECERLLQDRRGKGVVAGEQRALCVRDLRERDDVRDLHARIRWRFRPDQRHAAGTRRTNAGKVAHVDGDGDDAASHEKILREQAQSGVAVVGNQDARAVRQRFEQRRDCGHARGKGQCDGAAFKRGERGFQAILGRVAFTLVFVTGDAFGGRTVRERG